LFDLPEGSPLPWHRVVNARGEISHRSEPGCENVQRSKLEAEGIEFRNGRVAWTWSSTAGSLISRSGKLIETVSEVSDTSRTLPGRPSQKGALATPFLPPLRSGPKRASRPSRQKQFPSSKVTGLTSLFGNSKPGKANG
jgi:hypothetical protein